MSMNPIQLEKENLEAHVELCTERYRHMESRLDEIEELIGEVNDELRRSNSSFVKVIISTVGTFVASMIGLITTIVLK